MISPWIHTTDRCNLSCEYCHVEGDQTMAAEVYEALSRMLPKKTHVRIGGGEPLLVFDDWNEWCLQYDNVEVLTNFRHIPDGYHKLPDKVRTSVSVDGYGDKPLDREIIDNMKRLVTPWVMTTIGDVNALPLLAQYVSSNRYGWAISTNYFWKGDPPLEDLAPAMIEAVMILQHNDYDFRWFNFNNLSFAGRNGCCAGREMISVYCDGSIYPCQTCHNRMKPIGSVFSGKYTKMPKRKKKECESCSINFVCTGWCPLYHSPGNDVCKVMKLVVEEVFNAK